MKRVIAILLMAQFAAGCVSAFWEDTNVVAIEGRVEGRVGSAIELLPGWVGGEGPVVTGGRLRTDVAVSKVLFGTAHQKRLLVSMYIAGIPVKPFNALMLLKKQSDGSYDALIWGEDEWCIHKDEARELGVEDEMRIEVKKHPCRAAGDWTW